MPFIVCSNRNSKTGDYTVQTGSKKKFEKRGTVLKKGECLGIISTSWREMSWPLIAEVLPTSPILAAALTRLDYLGRTGFVKVNCVALD